MIRTLACITLLGVFPFLVLGQTSEPGSIREEIAFYADVLVNAKHDAHRARAHRELVSHLEAWVAAPGSFEESLDSIAGLSVLHGDAFRLVSWQYRVNDSLYQYGGFFQSPDKTVWLRDTRPFVNGAEFTTYSPEAWYGCLYYDILPFERAGKTLYVLLGFHAQDPLTNTKIADVLEVEGDQIRLGVPVFTGPERARTRLLLQYADVSTVHIRFDAELGAIVHDHLQTLPGVGPNGEPLPVADGSLEGWVLKEGNWEYLEKAYDVIVQEPPMMEERKDRKEDKDILGRPRKQ